MGRKLVGSLRSVWTMSGLGQVAICIVVAMTQAQVAAAGGGSLGTFDPSSTGYSVTKYGSISSSQDTWTFTVKGKATGTITLSSLTADLDLKLSNSQVSQKGGTTAESISFTLDPGTYSITVYPYKTARSGYSLRLNFTVEQPCVSDVDISGGTNPKGFFTKTIGTCPTGTSHWVMFDITAISKVPVRLSGMTIDLDMEIRKGTKTGQVVASSTQRGTATEDIVTTLDAGRYYLHIYRVGSSGSTSYRNEIQTGGTIRW